MTRKSVPSGALRRVRLALGNAGRPWRRTGRLRTERPHVPRHSFRTTALIIASALFMEQLDSTVLATALPTMARSFHVSPLHMSAALTSYLLGLALFIPASGYFADRFGARRIFRLAIGVFTVGSILCGQAPNLPVLVAARLFQGMGGAMMVPVGRLVLLRTRGLEGHGLGHVLVHRARPSWARCWGRPWAASSSPTCPGAGSSTSTCRSGSWASTWPRAFIEDVREPDPGQFDLRGFILSSISLSCLMYGLEMAQPRGRRVGPGHLGHPGRGPGGGRGLRPARARGPSPILDFRLMKIPTFGISVVGGSLTRITAGALPFLLPMMMQVGFGYSAARAGSSPSPPPSARSS